MFPIAYCRYERQYLEKWLALGNSTCPATGQILHPPITVVPNVALRKSIEEWCQTNIPWILVSLSASCTFNFAEGLLESSASFGFCHNTRKGKVTTDCISPPTRMGRGALSPSHQKRTAAFPKARFPDQVVTWMTLLWPSASKKTSSRTSLHVLGDLHQPQSGAVCLQQQGIIHRIFQHLLSLLLWLRAVCRVVPGQ